MLSVEAVPACRTVGKLRPEDTFHGSQIELLTKSNKKSKLHRRYSFLSGEFSFDSASMVSHKLFSNKAIYLEAFPVLPTSRLFP